MAVVKDNEISYLEINTLIDKLNAEVNRRKPDIGTISKLGSDDFPGDFDKIKAINDKRITVSKVARYRGCSSVTCNAVRDTGTPSVWNGSNIITDSTKDTEIFASQYNTLLQDIENLNAMCACDSYTTRYSESTCSGCHWGYSKCGCDTISTTGTSCGGCHYNVTTCSCHNGYDGCSSCHDSDCSCDSYCGCEDHCSSHCSGHCSTHSVCYTDSEIDPDTCGNAYYNAPCECDGAFVL